MAALYHLSTQGTRTGKGKEKAASLFNMDARTTSTRKATAARLFLFTIRADNRSASLSLLAARFLSPHSRPVSQPATGLPSSNRQPGRHSTNSPVFHRPHFLRSSTESSLEYSSKEMILRLNQDIYKQHKKMMTIPNERIDISSPFQAPLFTHIIDVYLCNYI